VKTPYEDTPYAHDFFKDSYTPLGTLTTIGRLQTYVNACQGSTNPSRGLLLLLPDGFGLAKHNLILADNFAKEGWHVIVPDYFEGRRRNLLYVTG
jgi:dienelactone hydrolase